MEKIKTHFAFSNLFSQNRVVYEIMSKNMANRTGHRWQHDTARALAYQKWKVSFVVGFECCTYFRFRASRKFHLGVTRQFVYMRSGWIQVNIRNCRVVVTNCYLLVLVLVSVEFSVQLCNVIASGYICFVPIIVWIEFSVQLCNVIASGYTTCAGVRVYFLVFNFVTSYLWYVSHLYPAHAGLNSRLIL